MRFTKKKLLSHFNSHVAHLSCNGKPLHLVLDCCFKIKFVDLVIRETIVAYLDILNEIDTFLTDTKIFYLMSSSTLAFSKSG